MARNKVAPIRTGQTGAGIALIMGTGLSRPIVCDRSAPPRAGRLSEIRISGRLNPLALVQGSGFRRTVDIKTNHAAGASFVGPTSTVRSLIAVSKQLVG